MKMHGPRVMDVLTWWNKTGKIFSVKLQNFFDKWKGHKKPFSVCTVVTRLLSYKSLFNLLYGFEQVPALHIAAVLKVTYPKYYENSKESNTFLFLVRLGWLVLKISAILL